MKTILTIFKKTVLLLLCALPLTVRSATVITISGSSTDDRIAVSFSVASEYSLKSVVADVNGIPLTLIYNPSTRSYFGTLDITDQPQGKIPVHVTIEDALGNVTTATKDFIHNSFPEIIVESPAYYSGHNTRLHVKARVTDIGSANCKGTVRSWWGSASFVNSIDTVFTAPSEVKAYDTYVSITATDSTGQKKEVQVNVYFDNSPHLKEQFAVTGVITDFKDSRLLVMNSLNPKYMRTFSIVDIRDSSVTHIPVDTTREVRGGYAESALCPGGAIINMHYRPDVSGDLLLWRNDSLINISEQVRQGVAYHTPIFCRGNYVMWTTYDNRTAVTDVTTLITVFVPATSLPPSPQGEVVYSKGDAKGHLQVFRYSLASQTEEQITFGDVSHDVMAIDSNDIVYARLGSPDDTLYLFNGQQHHLIGIAPTSSRKAILRHGYLLFNVNDITQTPQVWLRTTADTLRQLSFFSTESTPEALGDNGKSIFLNSGNKDRYYADEVTNFTRVSGGFGKTYANDGKLYLSLGNILYRYDLGDDGTPPLPANTFTVTNTGASCQGSANGAINVSAKQTGNYVATFTGNGKDSTYAFARSLTVDGLAAGTYNICLTTKDAQQSPQCFTSVIKEPAALSAAMVTSEADGKTRLLLSGGNIYRVEVNGRLQTTQAGEMVPDLRNGLNTIIISTDKPCQGTIVKHITREGDATVYPNPFSESLMISLGSKPVSRAVVTLYDASGKIVYSRAYTQQSGVITIEPGDIGKGVYMLKLNADQREQTFKLLKK